MSRIFFLISLCQVNSLVRKDNLNHIEQQHHSLIVVVCCSSLILSSSCSDTLHGLLSRFTSSCSVVPNAFTMRPVISAPHMHANHFKPCEIVKPQLDKGVPCCHDDTLWSDVSDWPGTGVSGRRLSAYFRRQHAPTPIDRHSDVRRPTFK